MNDDKRQQILLKLRLRKIQEIHSRFDKDNDGFLNYEELSSLQHVTSGQSISRRKYKSICSMLECKPSKGLTVQALVLAYNSNGEQADVDSDFDKVFGIKRDNASVEPSMKGQEEEEEKKEELKASKDKNHRKTDEKQVCETQGQCTGDKKNQTQKQSEYHQNDVSSSIPYKEMGVNLMDLLKAGDDPIIKSSTDGGVKSSNSTNYVTLKQIPSNHIFQDITSISMDSAREDRTGSKRHQNEIQRKSSDTHALQGSKDVKLVSESSPSGKNQSVMPAIISVVDSQEEEEEEEYTTKPSSYLHSIEGLADCTSAKKDQSFLAGMEGTAYTTNLHPRRQSTEDECNCLCTIM